jgi:hypothetical protein
MDADPKPYPLEETKKKTMYSKHAQKFVLNK